METFKNPKNLWLVGIILWGVIIASFKMTSEDLVNDNSFYCHMTKIWKENSHISPERRPGWPPYKGVCHG